MLTILLKTYRLGSDLERSHSLFELWSVKPEFHTRSLNPGFSVVILSPTREPAAIPACFVVAKQQSLSSYTSGHQNMRAVSHKPLSQ